jgi:sec-independent protein translocase protein TatC
MENDCRIGAAGGGTNVCPQVASVAGTDGCSPICENALLPFLIASPVMFLLGAAFAYYIILPWAFDFFLGFQQMMVTDPEAGPDLVATDTGMAGIMFQGSMEQYLSLTTNFILAFGLCFQLPVLLTLMGKAGLISARGLAGMRRYAIVLILILAAVVTPPDMMSQLILFLAIYPLYEVSIFLIRRIEKRREADLRAQGLWVDPDEDEAEKGGA